ncbi:histidine phosphatase family protein [Streptomyces sp. NPDC026673]|uniref:histidine phosphatase family protein n=1 Tax=Streptomyces sp. NPDC026673 TaxID=3155724 RepID=UPI0033E8F355
MTGTASRYLYLTRHAETLPDGSGLTEHGFRQAGLLGERLGASPVSAVHHSPLPGAAQSAALIGERLGGGVPVAADELAGDYPPYFPPDSELPPDSAYYLSRFLDRFGPEERTWGPQRAREALTRYAGPMAAGKAVHELVVTHDFLIGWLVSAALDAPRWHWLSMSHANAALTVIRYTPGRPNSVLLFNDMRHLPEELRWTGFPAELHF